MTEGRFSGFFLLVLAATAFLSPIDAQQSGKPDFQPVNMKLTGTNIAIGKIIKFEADIKNHGQDFVRPISIGLYIGTKLEAEKTINGIAKNSSKKVIFNWEVHPAFTGDQVFKIVADHGNAVAEAEENNYIATLNVHIPEPILNMKMLDFTFTPAKPEGGRI
jgi:subtilase family serine protease